MDWSDVQVSIFSDPHLGPIRSALEKGISTTKHYTLEHGILLYKGKLAVPSNFDWVLKLIAEFHVTPSGCHAGAYCTYRRLAANVHWSGMISHVTQFVVACSVCQRQKYDTRTPAGLLNPLPIPSQVGEDISLDFIFGLPRSGGFDCIFVVVDRLYKYGHFVAMRHPFTTRNVAEIFTKEIVRLHGIPRSIVSDRDPIFLSSFWSELFRSSGTKLKMSSSYHLQTDGQTEVLNRCLETYLRCFSSENHSQWSKWLAWAEFCYNTSFHSAAGTTPFEIVYGRAPPTLHSFLPGEVHGQAVLTDLMTRDEMLSHLRFHLQRAQQRMVTAANKHRRHVEYSIGDFVYLKFQLYREATLFKSENAKLAPRYFGPFEVIEQIGPAAYRLKLPLDARIHSVFHVSLLRKAIGANMAKNQLPTDLLTVDPPYLPESILARKTVVRDGVHVDQVLIKWCDLGEDDATWLDVTDVRGQFPHFSLEDKAAFTPDAVDTDRVLQVYKRGLRKVAAYIMYVAVDDTSEVATS